MDKKFITLLCCPDTREDLSLFDETVDDNGLVHSGILRTAGGKEYRIVNGVPRFVSEESYSESFGYEWKKWSKIQFEDQNTTSRMKGHTTKVFDMVTGFTAEMMAGKRVLEFGCGPGRFLDLVRKRGGIAIGLELSTAADVARENFKGDADTLIVQGDILKPPFKGGVFDLSYSIGVFHHTPNPAQALQKMATSTKSGGMVACCVYENNNGKGLYDSLAVIRYRAFFNSINANLSRKLAVAYSYFSAYFLYYFFFPSRKIPGLKIISSWLSTHAFPGLYYLRDGRWRVLDTFDAITPKYATTHTPEELAEWFEKAGCVRVSRMPFGKTSFIGTKK